MDCVRARKILLKKDVEPTSGENIAAASHHVAQCARCQQYFRYNEQFQEFLQTRLSKIVMPPDTRETLLEKLSDSQRIRKSWVASLTEKIRSISKVAAVLILLAIGLIIFFLTKFQHADDGSKELIAFCIEDQIKLQKLIDPLDIETPNKDQLEQWFAKRVDFAISVPVIPNAILRGGRLCGFSGKRIGLTFFQTVNRSLAVYILDDEEIKIVSDDGVTLHEKKQVCKGSGKGLNVVILRDDGLLYCLVSSMPSSQLEELASEI